MARTIDNGISLTFLVVVIKCTYELYRSNRMCRWLEWINSSALHQYEPFQQQYDIAEIIQQEKWKSRTYASIDATHFEDTCDHAIANEHTATQFNTYVWVERRKKINIKSAWAELLVVVVKPANPPAQPKCGLTWSPKTDQQQPHSFAYVFEIMFITNNRSICVSIWKYYVGHSMAVFFWLLVSIHRKIFGFLLWILFFLFIYFSFDSRKVTKFIRTTWIKKKCF